MSLPEFDSREGGRLWWFSDLGIEMIRKELDTTIPKHTHDDWQIARGIRRWWHGRGVHGAGAGSLVIVGPGEVHATDAPGRSPWRVQSVRIPDSIFRTVADEEEVGATHPASGLSILDDGRLGSWYAMFWRAATEPASALERTSALNGLVAALLSRQGIPLGPPRRVPSAVDRAREFLHADPAREVSLAKLAEVAGLSPFTLNRTFALAVGLPPHAYQIQLRMRRARVLLLGGISVAEAASRAGFADQSHLGRYFKRFGHRPPGEYRRVAGKS